MATTSTFDLVLGTSFNGLVVTTTTGTFTLTNAKTLAVTNTLTLGGTDGTTMTFPTVSGNIMSYQDVMNEDWVVMRDDFIGGSTSGTNFGAIGELGWSAATIAGTSVFDWITGVSNRWGIFRAETATAGSDAAQISLNWGASFSKVQRIPPLNAITGWKFRFIARINSIAACNFRIGLVDDPQNAQPSNGIWFEFEAASDTFYTAVTRSGGSETESASAVAADTGWHVFDIYSNVAGTILFSVDGGSAISLAATVPSAALCPSMIIQTTTTAAKSADIDFFAMYAPITR